jgi:hypothetical protein
MNTGPVILEVSTSSGKASLTEVLWCFGIGESAPFSGGPVKKNKKTSLHLETGLGFAQHIPGNGSTQVEGGR